MYVFNLLDNSILYRKGVLPRGYPSRWEVLTKILYLHNMSYHVLSVPMYPSALYHIIFVSAAVLMLFFSILIQMTCCISAS